MKELYMQEQQVQAIKDLLKNYKSKISILNNCPLCSAISSSAGLYCHRCIWVIETGDACISHRFKDFNNWTMSELRNGVSVDWTKKRIKELTKWIKKYDIEN